jgi:hypothetical protein
MDNRCGHWSRIAHFEPLVDSRTYSLERFASKVSPYATAAAKARKHHNRLGRGYSFEVVRAKLLPKRSCHKLERATYERRPEGLSMGRMTASFSGAGRSPEAVPRNGPINLGDRTGKIAG